MADPRIGLLDGSDRFEEVGAGLYRRRLVTVQGAAGYLEAEAYIASDKLRTKLQGNWDPNVFEATYLGEYLATVVAHFRVEEAVRVQSEKG